MHPKVTRVTFIQDLSKLLSQGIQTIHLHKTNKTKHGRRLKTHLSLGYNDSKLVMAVSSPRFAVSKSFWRFGQQLAIARCAVQSEARNQKTRYVVIFMTGWLRSGSVGLKVASNFLHAERSQEVFKVEKNKNKSLTMSFQNHSCNDNQNYFVQNGRTTSRVLNPPGGKTSFTLGTWEPPVKKEGTFKSLKLEMVLLFFFYTASHRKKKNRN